LSKDRSEPVERPLKRAEYGLLFITRGAEIGDDGLRRFAELLLD
jgi:hypothetical protein